jgi:hypothetical protein
MVSQVVRPGGVGTSFPEACAGKAVFAISRPNVRARMKPPGLLPALEDSGRLLPGMEYSGRLLPDMARGRRPL